MLQRQATRRWQFFLLTPKYKLTPPEAYRIFWHYGPGKNVIKIMAITPHP
jgi:hypothetical protein